MAAAIEWLKGKKTYFVLAAAGIVWTLSAIGVIAPETATSAYTVLALVGGGTAVAKIHRLTGS